MKKNFEFIAALAFLGVVGIAAVAGLPGNILNLLIFMMIIALTAHALASDREKAMEVGCDGYLAKPCEPRAVVAEVQRFLGTGVTAGAAAAPARAGGA